MASYRHIRRPSASRDKLAILGLPFGNNAALSATHANHVIGTNDFIYEFKVRVDTRLAGLTAAPLYEFTGWRMLMLTVPTRYIRLYINATNYTSSAPAPVNDFVGRFTHIMIFGNRDGLAYFYCDGEPFGTADISAQVAATLGTTTLYIGGKFDASHDAMTTSIARIFSINPVNTFTVAQMNAVAHERFQNPEQESPTLLARANYTTERVIDIDFNDVSQDGTTVPNKGTGAVTFTIGAGLHWHDVRTIAEKVAIVQPPEDWYAIDATHTATIASANLGCVQGSYVCETIVKNLVFWTATANRIFEFGTVATNRFYTYVDPTGIMECGIMAGGANYYLYPSHVVYTKDYMRGLQVIHHIYDADTNLFSLMIGGHILKSIAVVADMDLSGNHPYGMPFTASNAKILAGRLWNVASLPANYTDIARYRAMNPWSATDNTFTGMTLRLNYEMRLNNSIGQGASSTLVKNLAQPGTGDLTISGGGNWSNSTVKVLNGRAQ